MRANDTHSDARRELSAQKVRYLRRNPVLNPIEATRMNGTSGRQPDKFVKKAGVTPAY
jgi:hypothetical protein